MMSSEATIEELEVIREGDTWYFPSLDKRLPVIAGGSGDSDEDDDEDEEDDDNDDDSDEDEDPPKKKSKKETFSQEDMQRVATKEKREGKVAGRKDVLQKLDVESIEEAQRLIDAGRRAGKGKKSKKESDDDDTEDTVQADASKAEIAKLKHEQKVDRRLLAAKGFDASKLGKAAKLIAASDLEIGADSDDIDAAIGDLKDEFPELFKASKKRDDGDEDDDDADDEDDDEPKSKRRSKDSDPPGGGKTRRNKGGKSSAEKAKDRLARRHPNLVADKK